jgi:hypothetical protein
MALRPTVLIVFRNSRGGTPMMQAEQLAGIDLPPRLLVWEEQDGAARLAYAVPAWITRLTAFASFVDGRCKQGCTNARLPRSKPGDWTAHW